LRRLISVIPASALDDYDVNVGRMRRETAKARRVDRDSPPVSREAW
jgi:hypothetical protein